MSISHALLGAAALLSLSAAAFAGGPLLPQELAASPTRGGAPPLYHDSDRDGTLNVFDCNDDDPLIGPGAKEILNGFDDNCDGTIDEGFDTTVDRAVKKADRVLWPDGKSRVPAEWVSLDAAPRLVWTGAVFVAVWADRGNTLRLARITPDGISLDATPVTLRGNARAPDIAWTGTRLGIVYEDHSDGGPDIRLMTLDRYGSLLVDTLVHVDAAEPRIAWGQEQFGIVWRRATCAGDCIGYRTFNPDGRPLYSIETLPNSGSGAAIAWSGSGTEANTIEWNTHPGRFGIVYEAHLAFAATGDVLLALKDPFSYGLGDVVTVNAHRNDLAPGGAMPSIAGNAAGFAVSWHVLENAANMAHLRFFGLRDLAGALEFPPDADAAFGSNIAWTGSQFVVVNENAVVGPPGGTDVHFRPVDASGNAHAPGNWGPWSEVNVSSGAGGAISTQPTLANAGWGFGLIWIEQEDGQNYGRIRFATVVHR